MAAPRSIAPPREKARPGNVHDSGIGASRLGTNHWIHLSAPRGTVDGHRTTPGPAKARGGEVKMHVGGGKGKGPPCHHRNNVGTEPTDLAGATTCELASGMSPRRTSESQPNHGSRGKVWTGHSRLAKVDGRWGELVHEEPTGYARISGRKHGIARRSMSLHLHNQVDVPITAAQSESKVLCSTGRLTCR